jgi:phosphoglycolate phosphatase-like HAD superfamily hydrolase
VKKDNSLLCLDFDGVICDSINECLVSSWISYYKNIKEYYPIQVTADMRILFSRLRPFIRSGPDYVLIQKLIDMGCEVRNQHEFDRHLEKAGKDTIRYYGEIFYRAREELLRQDRDYWMALNPLYKHMIEPLRLNAENEKLIIVSTKRQDFILEILGFNRIDFSPERVYLADTKAKIVIVEEVRRASGFMQAVFIDDQIDHLLPNRNKSIMPALASWGYIKRDWLEPKKDLLILNPDTMADLFNNI